MVIAPLSLKKDYWQNFEIQDDDLDFIYNYLLEVETPQTSQELVRALSEHRIRQETEQLKKQQAAAGPVYYPKDRYQVGDTIQFPHLNFQTGKILSTRPGKNPEIPPFEVIEVQLEEGEKRLFASGVEEHKLNQPVQVSAEDPLLDLNYVIENYGDELSSQLSEILEESSDLVRIGFKWFPRALLVDINIGHLNLAEAVLDMIGGGPLPTRELMEQIDLPSDVDENLNEFSLNLALQEDKRFDEVGPAGEVLWYLHRLEPEPVRETPIYLRYSPPVQQSDEIDEVLQEFEGQVIDELEPNLNPTTGKPVEQVTLSLIYPHWRAGTLPLAGPLAKLFPTAYESPRIQFTFVDGSSGEKFSGWVVRPNKYVYGLREWYLSNGLIAGSLIHVQRGKNPGEVVVRADRKRGSRDWIRTAIVGSDGGIVFSMLKHNQSTTIDERMAIVVTDIETLDAQWERGNKQRTPLHQTVRKIMRELAKLSPQNHVHAQELYAGINILRRCPPGPIVNVLLESPWAKHLGNLYFRLDEASGGDNE
jgi:hypothetical protein